MQSPCLMSWCLACSICGSDMHPYAGRGVPLDSGITFGHEFTGQVVAAGSEVRGCPSAGYSPTPLPRCCVQQ